MNMSLAVDDCCEMDESEDIYMPPPPMSSRHSRLHEESFQVYELLN